MKLYVGVLSATLAMIAPGIAYADDVQLGIDAYAETLAYDSRCAKRYGAIDLDDQLDILSYASALGYDHKNKDQRALLIHTALRMGEAFLNDIGEPDPVGCLRSKASTRSLAKAIRSLPGYKP